MKYHSLISSLFLAFVKSNHRLQLSKCPETFKIVFTKIANTRNAHGFTLYHTVDKKLSASERQVFRKTMQDIEKLTVNIRPTFNMNSMFRYYIIKFPTILATDNVIFVAVVYTKSLGNLNNHMYYITRYYEHYKFAMSFPKLLIVVITSGQWKYQQFSALLKKLFRENYLGVEFLRVIVEHDVEGRKISSFWVHQSLNPFARRYVDIQWGCWVVQG